MKLESKYFDSLRIARDDEPRAAPRVETCQWKGCANAGTHRAPRGRGQEGYYRFCMDHVRQFNASYNYFEGMSNAEVEQFQKSSATGHRPTWRMGGNGAPPGTGQKGERRGHRYARFSGLDAHEIIDDDPSLAERPLRSETRRPIKALERKALDTLHLPETAGKDDIKARFKELVKRHHPDANGGDRGSEDKLREIIQAYNYLKQAGLV
ncbi:MAG: DnaJ domain-containing protein [Hyphomicrobiaceae bacterium]